MALKKIGALWLKTKDGKTSLSGPVNEPIPAGTNILVFKNTYKKEGERTPDYTIHMAVDDQPAPQETSQVPPPGAPEDAPF